jgi:ABC-type uncharacterized transport system ATPase subunit
MSSEFYAKIHIVNTVNIKITTSGFEEGANENLTHSPKHILNNDNLDGDKRWVSHGDGQWLELCMVLT